MGIGPYLSPTLTGIGPGTSRTTVIFRLKAPKVPGALDTQAGRRVILWGEAWQEDSSMRRGSRAREWDRGYADRSIFLMLSHAQRDQSSVPVAGRFLYPLLLQTLDVNPASLQKSR